MAGPSPFVLDGVNKCQDKEKAKDGKENAGKGKTATAAYSRQQSIFVKKIWETAAGSVPTILSMPNLNQLSAFVRSSNKFSKYFAF